MREFMNDPTDGQLIQGGDVMPLRIYPDAALKTKCLDVPDVALGSPTLHKLVMDMTATMYLCGGVGLAAPQVGVPWRLIICDIHANLQGKKPMLLTFVNPTIVEHSEDTSRLKEGCLSFPGVREVIKRPATITVEACDANGEPVRLQSNGWLGRVIQHEVDHLDGILMVDRLGPVARRQVMRKLAKVNRAVNLGEKKLAKAKRKQKARAQVKKKRRGK